MRAESSVALSVGAGVAEGDAAPVLDTVCDAVAPTADPSTARRVGETDGSAPHADATAQSSTAAIPHRIGGNLMGSHRTGPAVDPSRRRVRRDGA